MSERGPQISLQTFTIRKALKDKKGLTAVLTKVKALGINSLELARVPFTDSYIDQVVAACKVAGITVGSTQMKLKEIEKDKAWTATMHKKLNCPFCVVSVVSFSHLKKGEPGIKAYAERLNELGAYLKKKDVNLLFHHHNFEFVPMGDSDGFSILMKYLDSKSVGLVFDTYWLQRSGHDPADFIRKHKGLVKGVHLRDFSLTGPIWNPGIRDAELGRGNLDFSGILEACREAEVSYGAIEQNSAHPWESLKISLDYLKSIGELYV